MADTRVRSGGRFRRQVQGVVATAPVDDEPARARSLARVVRLYSPRTTPANLTLSLALLSRASGFQAPAQPIAQPVAVAHREPAGLHDPVDARRLVHRIAVVAGVSDC